MSSKITVKPHSGVATIGLISIIAGLVMILVGGVAWAMVASQLAAENITVSADSKFMANKNVNDPFSAFAQASSINEHAQALSGGKTYADLDSDDPMREVIMNASFLRASLFTSVVAFGVSAFVAAVGLLAVIMGWALRRTAGGPPLVIETTDSGPVEFEKFSTTEKAAIAAAPKDTGTVSNPPVAPQRAPATPPAGPSQAAGEQTSRDQGPLPVRRSSSGDFRPVNPSPLGAKENQPADRPVAPVANPRTTESRGSAIPGAESKPAEPALRANTGTIPVVAVPPIEPQTGDQPKNGTTPVDKNGIPSASEQPEATRPTGANGWSTPADRLPKQPEK